MPDHDALLHAAHLQWGYVTVRQAASCGFSRQLCHHYCRKGSWVHAARTVYRIHAVPQRPDEDLALLNLLAHDKRGRPAGVLSHHTALYLHGMLTRRPERVHLSLDPMSEVKAPAGAVVFHRRIDLPWRYAGLPSQALPSNLPQRTDAPRHRHPWAEPWRPRATASGVPLAGKRPSLAAEDIDDRGCFRVTAPLRTIHDCMAWQTRTDLSDVIERGLRLGLFDIDACLQGLEGLLRLPGGYGLMGLLRAVRLRAAEVERDLQKLELQLASVRHIAEQRQGLPWEPFADEFREGYDQFEEGEGWE